MALRLRQGRQAFQLPNAHLDAGHKPRSNDGFDLSSYQEHHDGHSARLPSRMPVVSGTLWARRTDRPAILMIDELLQVEQYWGGNRLNHERKDLT